MSLRKKKSSHASTRYCCACTPNKRQIQKTSGVGVNEHVGLEGGGEGDGPGMVGGGVAGSGLNAIREAHTRK